MREFIKVFSVVLFCVGAVAAALAWNDNRPTETERWLRYVAPLVAILALVLFAKVHFEFDRAYDYLRDQAGTYFNRSGFCFSFAATGVEGVAYLNALFQSQRDRPCIARIALRPARGLFIRPKLALVVFDIQSAPAEFGLARLAIPVPSEFQGKKIAFEVGATVNYPQGKGRRLRFGDGTTLRANADFHDAFRLALTIGCIITGRIFHIPGPPTTEIMLPTGVADEIDERLEPECKTLWRLGDAPLTPAPDATSANG